MTPKHGGAAATAWAAWRGLSATAAAPVAPSSQHAAVSVTVPDAVVAGSAAASGPTPRDSDAVLVIRTCSVVSASRGHVSPAAHGGSEPAVRPHNPTPAGATAQTTPIFDKYSALVFFEVRIPM